VLLVVKGACHQLTNEETRSLYRSLTDLADSGLSERVFALFTMVNRFKFAFPVLEIRWPLDTDIRKYLYLVISRNNYRLVEEVY
jgi:hypothetical protein